MQELREAARIGPLAADAHNDLAQELALAGRQGEALEHFREAMRLREDWALPMSGAALVLATRPQISARNTDEAIRLARRAAELTSRKDQPTLEILAACYASAGKFAEAVATQKEAVQLAADPAKAQAQAVLAGYQQQLGR